MRLIRKLSTICAAVAVLGLGACANEFNAGERAQFNTGINYLRLALFDGFTGAAVTGATIEVDAGPLTFTATEDTDSPGSYLLERIPGGTHIIRISAENFANFYGTYNFASTSSATTQAYDYDFASVRLFPSGNASEDLIIGVYNNEDGSPIDGATVIISFDTTVTPAGVQDFINDGDVTVINNAGLTSTSATTDSSGQVTIAATSLVFGATYNIDVFGAVVSNQVLTPTVNTNYTAGSDANDVSIFMGFPTTSPTALSVNTEGGSTQANLQVTFPHPIEICSESPYTGVLTWTDGGAVGAFPTIDADDPVTAALSSNNTVLTLTYNLDTSVNTEDSDDGLEVAFTGSGVQVKIAGTADSACTSLDTVGLRSTGDDLNDTNDDFDGPALGTGNYLTIFVREAA